MNKQEILEKLNRNDITLFETADKIRQENVGNGIHLRALIEFSNVCKCNCKYCGLQACNKNITRYRMSSEKIIEQAKLAANLGYKTIVLQSGEDNYYSQETLCETIKEIKKNDVAITLSIGEKTFDEYKAYKQAGADRYLLRIETTDRKLYEEMHPGANFENRVRCLEDLKTLGYEVGTGCLIGLPNQALESLADDIIFFKKINADMVGIGPFIPHSNTPLGNEKNGDFELALKVMALTRINMPKINIPATTAMETLKKNGRIIALKSGANVVMPNVTPIEYQEKYDIYPNKIHSYEFKKFRLELEESFFAINRFISKDYGNSKNYKIIQQHKDGIS